MDIIWAMGPGTYLELLWGMGRVSCLLYPKVERGWPMLESMLVFTQG